MKSDSIRCLCVYVDLISGSPSKKKIQNGLIHLMFFDTLRLRDAEGGASAGQGAVAESADGGGAGVRHHASQGSHHT